MENNLSQPSNQTCEVAPPVLFPKATSAVTAREKFNFNVASLLLSSVSAAALAASSWKRKKLFITTSVENETLRTFEFGIETTINEASKLLIPFAGFYGKHFGSIKPKGECKAAFAVSTTAGPAIKCLGWPTWATSLALIQSDCLAWGAIDWPLLNERLVSSGKNTYLRRSSNIYNRLPPLPEVKLSIRESVIISSFPTAFYEECALAALDAAALHVDCGFGTYAFALLAKGTIDVVIDYDISPQLLVSIIPILHGVGCVVTDWAGRETFTARKIVAARNKELASKVAATLTLFSIPAF
ncbi:MAG: inositol monophosphatase family protein [Candidatus Hodgkinia cicadicola]